ncbi:YceI family protein [Legionella fallonii]|uniref:Polyprenyl-pyrophosphate binding protein n=1 Tax=Legionella fallonii LLAP-10 TaxID=1212491 RepID=A0A098GA07_9GAMM|nr:YceI family protein [Legionella fallonii]CEG58320.1 Polyprenyl-pyrophosphate binding protein [Legionella fallonii LLAP-10]
MLRKLANFILTSTVLFALSLPGYAADKFILDDQHTYVLWHINHLGFSTQAGKWYAKGFVILDKEQPKNSKVEATIDVSSVSTGLPELDKHLKSPLFFDTDKYPTATYVSNKVDVLSKTSAKVQGVLTLHGVSKLVTLMVTLNKVGKNPITDKISVGFSAKTDIKRSDFGINTLLPDVGDNVSLEIGAEGYQSNSGN